MTRPRTRVALLAIAIGLLSGGGWWLWNARQSSPVDLATLTLPQWREDLQYLARGLARRHLNAFHLTSRDEYARLVARIDSALPGLEPADIPVYFSKLAAAVGDAHTFLSLPAGQHFYPFSVYYFGDTARVTATTPEHRDLLGTRLVKIDGTGMDEVQANLDEILTRGENPSFYRGHYPRFLTAEVLHALHVVRDSVARFTFAKDDGSTLVRTMAAAAGPRGDWVHPYAEPPLYLAHAADDWWFTTLPGTRTAYVIFNGYRHLCANASDLFDSLDRHPPDRLIIDLRANGGGDYLQGHRCLIAPVLARPQLNRRGHLFVVTGRFTFSAAMNNAAQFRTETRAMLVGEPPGEMPNSYQERRTFRLPNSHLLVNYSVRYYRFLPQDVPALLPDREVDPDWASYRAGRDPVLAWILSDTAER
ncbi:MAG TPA: hypothetical protein VFK78_12300 [Gemmatimonadales bacterium]|nr:hypothetical protein [Gemmatimonadales bacterium]